MGASFVTTEFDGKLSKNELRKEFSKYQEQSRYESGHSYSGELGMCEGLLVEDKVFETYNSACDYICDNTHKWEYALAVKIKGGEWVVGGVCSS